MKIISAINNYCQLFLGEQKINNDIEYRLLHFCRLVEDGGIFLLYNNLTKELLKLDEKEFELLTVGKFSLNKFTEYLIKHWFLVPVNNDDMKLNNQLLTMVKLTNRKDYIDDFVVLTTTDCNARCFYCYEHGIKKFNMTEETANSVAEYIIKVSKGHKVYIKWFGGEPLYNMPAIDIICTALRSAGVNYASTMTSNGYLFDEQVVNTAKTLWNLKRVQITLDGTEEVYNRCKNYIYQDGISPYKKVLENIEFLISQEIIVRLRVNLGVHNYENIYTLINELYQKFGNSKCISIYIATIYEKKDNLSNDSDYATLMENLFKLENYAYEKGVLQILGLSNEVATSFCFADRDNAVGIVPTGKLTKCEHFLENEFVGDLWSSEINKDIWDSWKERVLVIDLCHNCPYYPTCLTLKKCSPSTSRACNIFEQKRLLRDLDRKIIKYYKNKTQ